jgi:hypothetical protein
VSPGDTWDSTLAAIDALISLGAPRLDARNDVGVHEVSLDDDSVGWLGSTAAWSARGCRTATVS